MDSIDENGYMVYKYQDPRYVPHPYVLSYKNLFQQWTVSRFNNRITIERSYQAVVLSLHCNTGHTATLHIFDLCSLETHKPKTEQSGL